MKNALLPIIGLLVVCYGLIAFVVFEQKELGIIFIGIGILFQVLNYILIVKKIKSRK